MGFATLTIDLKKVSQNIDIIKQQLGESTNILLIAKANAYGMGAIPICKAVADKISYIGVATVDEALECRHSGIKTPILLLSEPFETELNTISAHDITLTVYDKSTIDQLHSFTKSTGRTVKTHLKIDTGMNRLGSHWEESKDIIKYWQETCSNIIKEGIYSHFANSGDKKHPLNVIQKNRFDNHQRNSQVPLTHFANSDAINHLQETHYNLVRIGLAAYENSFTLTAPLRYIKSIKSGNSVGYGNAFTAQKDCRIGVIGSGYADGISTHLSNKGYVIINNHQCRMIGTVCMDMFMVELPESLDVSNGDTAIIISPESDMGMTIHECAKLSGQNPREIMSTLSNRVRRIYLDN
jgi:alanine racemase